MRWSAVLFLVCMTSVLRGHDPLTDLPAPTSVGEAWNVINQSVGNIGTCLETGLNKDVIHHVANSSPAFRLLQQQAKLQKNQLLWDQIEKLYYTGDAIVTAAQATPLDAKATLRLYHLHQAAVAELATKYAGDVTKSEMYVCPMHPLDRSLDKNALCGKCAMALIRRRIPASTTYEKPGAASMTLTAVATPGLKVGVESTVTVSLRRQDGSPVVRKELLTMHTEKIHLLIVDDSLEDYHHEHPTAGDKAGDFVFKFTPGKPGKYRIFADVVPAATSQQEYVMGEVASEVASEKMGDRQTVLQSAVEGFQFVVKFENKLVVNQAIEGSLTVLTPDGKPFKQLEPVMGAYAHLVGFNEDRKTVLHIHPSGEEPKTAEDRGGPTLKFKLYAPVAGFYKLYAQVQMGGEQKFAPLGITIEEK